MTAKTLVTFLLDRSGSMESIKDDTIGAFNAYLGGLQQTADLINFTLVQFDTQGLDKVCVRVPVAQAVKLDKNNFIPRAGTPLIDASYKTIKAVESSLNGDSETKVVICIQTDGHENASTEHTWDELNALIKEKTALGWQFNFMGAGIDAYDQGARMGISAAATMSYNSASPEATRAAFAASASNTVAYTAGLAASTNFSAAQRSASGDIWASNHPAGVTGAASPLNLQPRKPNQKKTTAVDNFSL